MLKQFTTGKKPQVWVFDKQTGKKFKSHIKNVASENGFYDFSIKSGDYTIEPSLSDIESHASQVFKDIIREGSIENLSQERKIFLSHFFALQFVRTRQHRQIFKDMADALKDSLEKWGDDPSQVKEYTTVDGNTLKLHGIRSILKSSEFAPYFLNKTWVLFKAPKEFPLYISDNPITLQNMIDHGFYGNIGLDVKGIEIYCPISKFFTIGMLCPSHKDEFRKTYAGYKLLMQKKSRIII